MTPRPFWVRLNRLPANRQLAWLHRWAGVAFAAFFFLWFATGAVLHFVGFPSLPDGDRHAASANIDSRRLALSPAAALARVPGAVDLRLVDIAGRPAYILAAPSAPSVAIAADDGSALPMLEAASASAIAEAFGHARAVAVEGPLDYDQWIVHQHFDPYRPYFRVRLDDPEATELHVSARTGEVIQRTRAAERAWNWCGAVLHWIYFTPLRKSWNAWNQVVWWFSLAALVTACVGFWLGIVRWAGRSAAARGGMSPFRGWLRWHHIAGLLAGGLVLAWIFSGWLSMDHGRLFSRGEVSAEQLRQVRALPLSRVADAAPLEALRALGPASEVDFGAMGSRAFLTVYGAAEPEGRVQFLDTAAPLARIPAAVIQGALDPLWPGRVDPATAGPLDDFYRHAESVPADAAAFDVGGNAQLRIYVDVHTGRPLALMDASRRTYAWVYYALHTGNFPGISERPALRTAVIMVLLALGIVFSSTGIVIGVLRIKRELA